MAATTTTSSIPVKDLTQVVEDSATFLVNVRETDPASTTTPPAKIPVNLDVAVDGTVARPAILRLAVKEDDDDSNANAIIFKTTHDVEEILKLTQDVAPPTGTLGQARVFVDKEDTVGQEPACHKYDLEVTRQDFLRVAASVGTLSILAGTNTIVGVGTAFTKAKRGDVVQPLGGVNDAFPAIIETIVDDTNLVVSNGKWVADEPGVAFEIRRGRSKTAIRGDYVLEEGQVKN